MSDIPSSLIQRLDPARHVLIAGPTASGKSALALRIAQEQGGRIVNADALQVWSCWRMLTARPPAEDEARAPHLLYGHVAPDCGYSVGAWLRDLLSLLDRRAIIVGGTGLYFNALTRGLARIPAVPPEIRAKGDALLAAGGLDRMIAALDPATHARIDLRNPARVQRAWEVLQATGRGLADWQRETPAPILPRDRAEALLLVSDRDWLADRIARRFDLMLDGGALDEVAAMAPAWDRGGQWQKAIGAAELMAHLRGELTLDEARHRAVIATCQYAKQQRSWFRGNMKDWTRITL